MGRHFRKLRCFLAISAVGTPILVMGAFVCYAAGRGWWAIGILVLGIVLDILFPTPFPFEGDKVKSKGLFQSLVVSISLLILIRWLCRMPEFTNFADKLLIEGGLWDWSPMVAGLTLMVGSIHARLTALNRVTDEMTVRHYEPEKSDAPFSSDS